jgi:hypothetical protein
VTQLRVVGRWRRSTWTLDSMKSSTVAAALLLALATAANATDYSSETAVLSTFECPESLKSDADRVASLQQFNAWIRHLHPDWSAPKIVGYRLYLLESHHCERDLAKFRADPSATL